MFGTNEDLLMAQINRDMSILGEYLEGAGGHLKYSKTKYNMGVWKFKSDRTPTIKKERELLENGIQIKEKLRKVT
eukprot:4003050-Ditylum_brightwellii.AAC.1